MRLIIQSAAARFALAQWTSARVFSWTFLAPAVAVAVEAVQGNLPSALTTIGLLESAQPLWASAASYEERIASLLDAHGESLEAAVHRISAASCYRQAGDPSRATNLYRAALAGPLRESTRNDVEAMLTECLALLRNAVSPKDVKSPTGQGD